MNYKTSVLVLVLVLIGGIYYLYPRGSAELTSKVPLQSIRVGNIGEYSILNLIAKAKGYFAENGLDASVLEYPSGPPEVADLLAGKLDFAVAADFVGARSIFDNSDLRIIANVDDHEDFQMLVSKASGISVPGDLKGKKIGVTLKGAGEFFLGRFLSFNDINPKDVTILNLTPDQMADEIENGQIDAAVIFNIHIYRIKTAMGDRVDVWPIQRTRRVFATSYTTSSFIKNNPAVVTKYLQALAEAEDYLQADPEGAKHILEEKMGYDSAYVSYIWPKFNFSLGLSQEFLLAMEDNARFIIQNKLTSETRVPNYLNYTYFNALSGV